MVGYASALATSVRRPAFKFLFALTMSLILLFAVLMYAIESPTNTEFKSFLDSAYFAVITMTGVGYGDLAPESTLGKLVTMVFSLLGTACYVSFTGLVASTIVEVELAEHQLKTLDQ